MVGKVEGFYPGAEFRKEIDHGDAFQVDFVADVECVAELGEICQGEELGELVDGFETDFASLEQKWGRLKTPRSAYETTFLQVIDGQVVENFF